MSKTMNDAYSVIDKEINEYMAGPPVAKTIPIENVGFKDIFKLYRLMDRDKADLFLPGEIGYENITVVYRPTQIFSFIIHSEPCIDFRWKVKQLKFNLQ